MLVGFAVMLGYFGLTATALVRSRLLGSVSVRLLAWWATSWAGLLVVMAVVLPIVSIDDGSVGAQPRHTLVRVHGFEVLVLVVIPLVVSLAVVVLLALGRAQGWWTPEVLAIVLSVALAAAGAVTFLLFLVGLFVLPTAGLLIAASMEQAEAHRRLPSVGPLVDHAPLRRRWLRG